jgi:hypothetical protein
MTPADQIGLVEIVKTHGITQAGMQAAFEQGLLLGAMRAAQAIASGAMTSGAATTTTGSGDEDAAGDTPLTARDIAALKGLGIDPAKKWRQRNSVFTVVAYKPNRWKYPVTCANQNGTRYKFPISSVVAGQR